MSVQLGLGKLLEEDTASEYEQNYEEDYEDETSDVSAPFALRCGALMIDYIVPAAIIVVFTLFARGMGEGATRHANNSFNFIGAITALVVTVLNFFGLAWVRGQTLGKWAAGIKIVKKDGSHASILNIILRHLIGYPLSMLFLFGGFLLATLTKEGRALHDFIAGTIVVKSGGVEN